MPVSAVVGLGYVGMPLAMRAVAAGHEVTGYDIPRPTVIVESRSCFGTTQEKGTRNPCAAPGREQQNAGSQAAVHSPAG
jgi:3-hydroxyisobutyrate dehydrogenase-like beta-hydroxyacid dehydrogenase